LSNNESSFATSLWDFFCSLKLTVVTLILLATTSIIGTVLPQDPGKAEQFRQQSGEAAYKLFQSLDFFDMYHSWWFLLLLALFSLNLICCSIKRFPKVWKTVHEPLLVAADNHFKTLGNVEEQLLKKPVDQVRDRVVAFLGREFAAPVVTEQDGKVYLFAQKAPYARFGVYVTHLSILIIFVGAIVGTLFGYKAYVNIVEGTATTQVHPRGSDKPIDLGFSVRCDEFSVSYYPGGQRPKEFKSLLTVTDNGQVVYDKRPIVVNDPLTHKGITFYQSSYGPAGDAVYTFAVTERASGQTVTVSGREKEHIALPGGASLIPMGYTDSYENFGPAAQVSIDKGDHQHGNPFIVLQNFPTFDQQRGDAWIVALTGAKQKFYTGLQVAKDPGVWVVWLGCALMVVGSMSAFFLSHRRLWVAITPVGDKTGVKIGGSAHRNQPGFEIAFDELKKKLKTDLAS